MRIILIRHASTEAARTRLIGEDCEDGGLSPEGIREAEHLRGILPPPNDGDVIVSSPLKRARETAELIFPHRAFLIASGLSEIDKGFPLFFREHPESARMTVDEWEAAYRTHLGNKERYLLPYPSGVSLASFVEGVSHALDALCAAHAGCRTLYCVTHNGPIRAILSRNAGTPYDAYFSESVPYASFRIIGE